MPTENHIEKKG